MSISWVRCASGNVLQFWPQGGTSCIGSKFGQQLALLALLHCLGLPNWHHQLVLSYYPNLPESHQLSLQKVCEGRTDTWTLRSDPGIFLGLIEINIPNINQENIENLTFCNYQCLPSYSSKGCNCMLDMQNFVKYVSLLLLRLGIIINSNIIIMKISPLNILAVLDHYNRCSLVSRTNRNPGH